MLFMPLLLYCDRMIMICVATDYAAQERDVGLWRCSLNGKF